MKSKKSDLDLAEGLSRPERDPIAVPTADDSEKSLRIAAKWGFGNAPLKPHHRERAELAIRSLQMTLAQMPTSAREECLEAISYVKGLFNRTLRQDQWDWYTVWALLGRPSRAPANKIVKTLARLRTALKQGDVTAASLARTELQTTKLDRYLASFLAGEEAATLGPSGFIYILSTRSQPRFLKIGMTRRTVEQRVKEINAATGVMIPYGVRAAWRVADADRVEREIHSLLADYRVRGDREFFEIEYQRASDLVNDYLNKLRRKQEEGEA